MATKRKYAGMMPIAKRAVKTFSPACHRIEIAGSLRRGNQTVGDIEIVAIPILNYIGIFKDLWESNLDLVLNDLVKAGKITKIRAGDKAKSYMVNVTKPAVKIDIFVANPINWGLIMAIRTGPAGYSKHIVTQRCKGGALDDDYRVSGGFLWRFRDSAPDDWEKPDGVDPDEATAQIDGVEHVIVPTPEESDFFQHIKGGYIPPDKRRYQ